MDPIINPIWFYVIHVVGYINFISILLSWIIGAVILLGGLISIPVIFDDDYFTEQSFVVIKQIIKYLLIAFCISLTIAVFTPSKEVMYQMLVASYVTPDNIQIVQDNTVEFIQRIVDAVKNIK